MDKQDRNTEQGAVKKENVITKKGKTHRIRNEESRRNLGRDSLRKWVERRRLKGGLGT